MRIGILNYRQTPYISANTDIGYLVGQVLKMRGHHVLFIGHKQDEQQKQINSFEGIPIRYMNANIPHKASRLKSILESKMPDRIVLREEAMGLRRIVRDENLDVLLCVCAPNRDIDISMCAKLEIPVFLYQLDPYYSNNDIVDERLKTKFLKILCRVERVFTTDLLYEQYIREPSFAEYQNKIEVLHFPKLIEPKHTEICKSNKQRLLYAGTLYRGIRSPQLLLRLKQAFGDTCDIIFCGSCDVDGDMEQLKDAQICCLGYCAKDVLRDEMEKAHCLINIGNSVRNQMGSKVIDYIAWGKPIINITQLEDCPTIKVLEEYPLKIHVFSESIEQEKINLTTFVEETKNKTIPWSEIKEKYADYTPEYIAGQIEGAMMLSIASKRGNDNGIVHK